MRCWEGAFWVNIDIAVNGQRTWRWVLSRRRVDVGDTETARRLTGAPALDEHGNPFFVTSFHSHIEEYNVKRYGEWDWVSNGFSPESVGEKTVQGPTVKQEKITNTGKHKLALAVDMYIKCWNQ